MTSQLETQNNRRELLLGIGAIVAASAACIAVEIYTRKTSLSFGPNLPHVDAANFPQEIPIRQNPALDVLDWNDDPNYRGSRVSLITNKGMYGGHGSLVNIDNEIFIYTISHVTDLIASRPSQLYVPGVGSASIQNERLVPCQKKYEEEDEAVYYVLGPESQEAIRLAEAGGKITVFELAFNEPVEGEDIALPGYIGYVPYRFYNFDKRGNHLLLRVKHPTKKTIMQGDSGSPLLQLESGDFTGKIYGTLQGVVNQNFRDPLEGYTYTETVTFARPNN